MKIGVIGHGKMGSFLKELIDAMDNYEFIDTKIEHRTLISMDNCDVLVDVSHPNNLDSIIDYCINNHTPICIATTGYSDKEIMKIRNLSLYVPVLYSANYSLGITLLNHLIALATPILKKNFDIEIIEAHHNQKIDAPSGTAKMLFDTININNDYQMINGRSGISLRNTNEVGIHSLRGGTIAGEHQINYIGMDEELTFIHKAYSRKVFAQGIMVGVAFIIEADIGLYDMHNVLFEEDNYE